MKTIKLFFLITLTSLLFASCNQEAIKPTMDPSLNGAVGAAWPSAVQFLDMVPEDNNTITVELYRSVTAEAASVPVAIIAFSDKVPVPSEFTLVSANAEFEAGSAKTNVVVSYGDINTLSDSKTYQFKLSIPDKSFLSVSRIADISINATKLYGTPTPKEAEYDKAVKISFSHSIERGEAATKAYMNYYAINNLADSTNFNKIAIHNDSIKVSGTTLTFNLPKPQSGIYVTLTWEEGLVKNKIGTKCKANTIYGFDDFDPTKSKGFTVRVPTKPIGLSYQKISAAGHGEQITMPKDTMLFIGHDKADFQNRTIFLATSVLGYYGKDFSASVKYIQPGKTQTIQLTDANLTQNAKEIQCTLPDAFTKGTVVDFILEAGVFEDRFGNPSAAISTNNNYFVTFNYNFATQIAGDYTLAGVSAIDSLFQTTAMVNISAKGSDSLYIKHLYKNDSKIKAAFDKDRGLITIDTDQKVGTSIIDAENFAVSFTIDGAEKVVFSIPEEGKIKSGLPSWGYYADPTDEESTAKARWLQAYSSTVLTKN